MEPSNHALISVPTYDYLGQMEIEDVPIDSDQLEKECILKSLKILEKFEYLGNNHVVETVRDHLLKAFQDHDLKQPGHFANIISAKTINQYGIKPKGAYENYHKLFKALAKFQGIPDLFDPGFPIQNIEKLNPALLTLMKIDANARKLFIIPFDITPSNEDVQILNNDDILTYLILHGDTETLCMLNMTCKGFRNEARSEIIRLIHSGQLNPTQYGITSLKELIVYFGEEECEKIQELHSIPFDFIFDRKTDIVSEVAFEQAWRNNQKSIDLLSRNFPNLKVISFASKEIIQETSIDLSEFKSKWTIDFNSLKGFSNLDTLDARGCSIMNFNALTTLPKLYSLNLSGCNIDENIHWAKFKNIKYLNLAGSKISCNIEWNQLIELRLLDLTGCQIDLKKLTPLTKLGTLVISGNKTDNLHALSSFPMLNTLKLSHDQIDFSTFPVLNELEELSLHNCQIQNLSALTEWKNLSDLSLTNCQLDDFTPLSKLTKLTRLFVIQCPVSDYRVFLSMPNLGILVLSQTLEPELKEEFEEKGIRVLTFPS